MDLLNEIIESAIGKDNNNKPKATITFSTDMFSIETKESRHVSSHPSYKAEVNIRKIKDYMMVDLVFPSALDNDLKIAWHDIEAYADAYNNIDDDSTEIPFLTLTIVPLIYKSAYYMCAVTPVFWTLQPQKPGGSVNTIKLLFEADDFGIFETDEIDIDQIQSQVDRDILTKEAEAEEFERREQEKQKEAEERNAKLEEFKRNVEK